MARKKRKEEDPDDPNLIPIMNVMLLLIPALLLAMEVASFAAISVTPPRFAAQADQKKEDKKEEEPLNLKVFIMEDGYRVSAQGQQQGAEAGKAADSTRPTIPLANPGGNPDDYSRYDYAALEAQAKKYKQLFPHETVVTISAENSVHMQVLVSTMDALRGTDCRMLKALQGEEIPPECYFWQPVVEAGAG